MPSRSELRVEPKYRGADMRAIGETLRTEWGLKDDEVPKVIEAFFGEEAES